jgi:hypothetical protein
MADRRDDAYTRTKRSLHALAELVLAGPRCRQGGSIELRVLPDGFRTRDEPVVAVRGSALVAAGVTVDLDGLTFGRAAARLGIEASRLDDVYTDGPKVDPDEEVVLDRRSVRDVEQALALGDQALRSFHPGADPILWPEHFDVAVVVGEVTYGVSPGDRHSDRPYAYVATPRPPTGPFWNAPFGAARSLSELDDADRIVAFFRQGSEPVPAPSQPGWSSTS